MAQYESADAILASASLSNPEAIFELGLLCATGRGGLTDVIAAHKWFNIAAFRGMTAAKARREEIASEMTREQIAAAQRAARDWLQRN
jgi:TPR repeat protein